MEILVIILLAFGLNEMTEDDPKYKGGLFNYIMLEDELKERERKRQSLNDPFYPIKDDYRGRVRKKGLNECETLKDECSQPIWGKYNDKHEGEFSEGFGTNGWKCECNW